MIIERTDKEILIRIPQSIGVESVQRIIDYIKYQEATSHSEATQEEVDKLAGEINKSWWEANKESFLR